MALEDLVRYVAVRRAQKPEYLRLHQMAARHGWKPDEVLAFVRCEKEPTKKMLRGLAFELGSTVEELERILER